MGNRQYPKEGKKGGKGGKGMNGGKRLKKKRIKSCLVTGMFITMFTKSDQLKFLRSSSKSLYSVRT